MLGEKNEQHASGTGKDISEKWVLNSSRVSDCSKGQLNTDPDFTEWGDVGDQISQVSEEAKTAGHALRTTALGWKAHCSAWHRVPLPLPHPSETTLRDAHTRTGEQR
jgi:hypothetical protein